MFRLSLYSTKSSYPGHLVCYVLTSETSHCVHFTWLFLQMRLFPANHMDQRVTLRVYQSNLRLYLDAGPRLTPRLDGSTRACFFEIF